MRECTKFYIDGQWVEPSNLRTVDVINPATEEADGIVALGNEEDVNRAVAAARRAFDSWSRTSREDRIALLERIAAEGEKRAADLAAAMTAEMGAQKDWSSGGQVPFGLAHVSVAIEILKNFVFEEKRNNTVIRKEPIGVCAMITPWNYPLNQIFTKVAPALATGCTMVLKPSEIAPYSAYIVAEMLDAAGVPAGVFNLVNGDGPGVGSVLSSHPEVDMVSFTGSLRAGVEVAKNAAPTVKRVQQELGGKGPNIILDDERFADGVRQNIQALTMNTGQSCASPVRMLVPAARMEEAKQVAAEEAVKVVTGDPFMDGCMMGPLTGEAQWTKVQGYIQSGVDEGAALVAGGPGRPDGLTKGYYAKFTVFGDVTPDMKIAKEEIFGPVVSIIAYQDEEEAIRIANDTPYGLSAYVWGSDVDHARGIADRIRAGMVFINGGNIDMVNLAFGGYKMSGNGREWGEFAFHDYVETKAISLPG